MSSRKPTSPNKYLPFVIIAVVLGAALAGAVLLYQKSTDTARTARLDEPLSTAARPTAVPPPRTPLPGAQPPRTRGGSSGENTATLEEFGDFQCPPCGAMHPIIKAIEEENGSRLRVIFRHLPLSNHAHALNAALAAEAAGRQNRFWEMHDALYEKQKSWSTAKDARPLFVEYARSLGLDVTRFNSDMNAPEVVARVRADMQRADSLGISGTPTLLINGREVAYSTVNDLRERIKNAVASAGGQKE